MSSRSDRRAEDGSVQGQTPKVRQYGDENSSVPLPDEVEGIKAENLDASSVEEKKRKKRFLRIFRLGKEKQEAPGEVSMTAPAEDNVDVPTVATHLSAPSATMDDPDASVDVSKPSTDADKIAEMSSFGGKVEAPTPAVSMDVSAPSAYIGSDKAAADVPSVGGKVGVSTPDVNVNVSKASVDVGSEVPDAFRGVPDVSAEVPKAGDVGKSAPDVGVSDDSAKVEDIKAELPNAPSVGGKAPKKGLRRIIDLAKKKLEALEIKGSVPNVKIQEVSGDISAPSASGDVSMPSAHIPSAKTGVSPSPVKGHAPEDGVSVTAPNVRVDVSAPSVDEGVKVPETPSAGVPPADLPSVGGDTSVSAPGVSMPSVGVDGKVPDVSVDVPAVVGTKVGVDVSSPSVDLGGQVPEMPPASGPSKGMGGNLPDVSLDGPVVTGTNVSVDVTAPSVELGGQVPDKPVVSGPSVDPPSVGGDVSVSVPSVSMPFADVSGKVPDVSVDNPAVGGADVSVDVLSPSVLDGKVPETSSVSRPPADKSPVGSGIFASASGMSIPWVDMSGMVPDMSVDVPAVDGASVSVPDASVEVSGPSVSASEASLTAPGVEVSKDTEVDASVPSMEGPKVTSDNVTSGVSAEVGGGEVDVKGSEAPSVDVKPKKGLLSKLLLLGKGNVEAPDVNVSEPVVEVNVSAPSFTVDASAPEVSTKAEGKTVDADVTVLPARARGGGGIGGKSNLPMAVAKPVILGGRRSGGRRLFSKYLSQKDKADASDVTEPDASVSAPDAKMSAPTVELSAAKNVADESASLKIFPVSKPDADSEDAKSAEVDSSRLSASFNAATGAVDDEDTGGATTGGDLVPPPPVPEASPDGDSDLSQKLAAALDAAGVPVDEDQADDKDTDIDVEAPVVPPEDCDFLTGDVIGFLFGGGEARHEEGQPQDGQGPTEETPAAASEDSTPAAKSDSDVTSPLKESSAGLSRDNDTLTSMLFGPSPKDKVAKEAAAKSTSEQSEEGKDNNNDKNDGGFFGMIAETLGLIPSNEGEDETVAPAAAADADAGATTWSSGKE